MIKSDFSKRRLKDTYFYAVFRLFSARNRNKYFFIFLINSTRAIDWRMNCHTSIRKNYGQFLHKGEALTKKKLEIFFVNEV
jgi:hypothetical protein